MQQVFLAYVLRVDQTASVDAGLHQRLLKGDGTALAELYDRFSALVYGLALRVTHEESIAQEVVQETFSQFWESADAFNPMRGSLRGQLSMVAHRKAVDRVRSNRAHKQAPQSVVDEGTLATPNEIAIERVYADQIASAVAALPNDQREVLYFAYYEGLTYRELAAKLGIPEETAKSRIRSGLQRLANSMRLPDSALEATVR